MKKGWQTTTLGEVATVQSGAGFPNRYQGQPDGEIPFYKVSDMNLAGNEREMIHENNSITEKVRCELRAFLFPKGSTIFPKIGGAIATNKKRLTTHDCCLDNNVMGVIPKTKKIDSNFLFYFFLSHDLSDFANEAHLPSIKKTVVEAWPISAPPLAEQRRIVAKLDEAFAAIAKAKENAEKNVANARAIFESELNAIFTKKGDGWKNTKLKDVCGFQNGFAFKSSTFKPSGDAILRISNIQDGRIDTGNRLVFFDPKDYRENLDRYRIVQGDLLIAMSGATTGKLGFNTEASVFYLNQRVGKFEPSKDLNKKFLYYYLTTKVEENLRISAGAAQPNLSTEQIKDFVLPLPYIDEQERIVADLELLSEEVQHLEAIYYRKIGEIEHLRQSLLHHAFTGQL